LNLAGFHILDVFFLVLGIYFIIRGCFRGFVGEIFTLAGFICSFYISFKFSGKVGNALLQTTGINVYVAQLLALIILWLVITIITTLLRKATRRVVSAMSLGSVDAALGLFSGIIKTAGVVYVFLIVGLLLSPVINPTWMTNSDILRYAGRHWPSVRSMLINYNVLAHASELPDGTLEQILRPYRTGSDGPKTMDFNHDKNVNYRA
jgi:uncharacterized membrane protein required for colicin V production